MHALPLGPAQDNEAALLVLMCRDGYFGTIDRATGTWQDKLDWQLARAWRAFDDFCSGRKIGHRQSVFSTKLFQVHVHAN